MEVACTAEQSALLARVTSIDNKRVELRSSVIEWTLPHLVTVTWRTQDDLSCSLSLGIDGERVGRVDMVLPHFLSNAITDYEFTLHRSGTDGSIGTPLGVIEVMAFADQRSPLDSARTLTHLMDRARNWVGNASIMEATDTAYARLDKRTSRTGELSLSKQRRRS
jgi:RNA binding exosome subunit